MIALLDWIDGVPSLTLDQWLVCVLPVILGLAIVLLPVIHRRRS